MNGKLQRAWFNVAAVVVGSFGPVFFLGAAGLTWPSALTLDLLSWPVDGNMVYNAPTTRFLSAITGGFLLGWGVTIWLIGRNFYHVAPEEARKTVVFGLYAWFLLDSAGSIASGNSSNALFNILVLAIAVGPLWTQSQPDQIAEAG